MTVNRRHRVTQFLRRAVLDLVQACPLRFIDQLFEGASPSEALESRGNVLFERDRDAHASNLEHYDVIVNRPWATSMSRAFFEEDPSRGATRAGDFYIERVAVLFESDDLVCRDGLVVDQHANALHAASAMDA